MDSNTARANALDRFKFQSHHIGLFVVVFALLVTAPRLTLTFIMSDGLQLNPTVEFWTMVGSAIAGAVVLTLGNAYLTHVLAAHFDRHDPLSWLLSAAWVIYLVFTTAIIAPALMVGVRESDLADVLPHPALQWAWCVICALCFEFLVAGSMAAYAIAARHVAPVAVPVEPIPQPIALASAPDAAQPVLPDTRSKRKRVMDALDESDGDVNDATLAEQIILSEATVRGYRAQWRKERQPLAVSTNGHKGV